ncbi:MAG: glycosyltransferase [Cryomorphaceae bacterium]|nr:glycosyltransferase [Cryomorphaceae bacterium]
MNGEPSYKPLVSVIIPNYNHAPFLKERIDSVLNQTYKNIEVILLDDCSSDNSREIIESYRGHEKISHIEYNTTNSGSTFKQWEKGINIAKGEWIWIAESDDVSDINFINELILETDAEMVYCNSQIIDAYSNPATIYGFTHMPFKKSYPCFAQNFTTNPIDFIKNWMLKDNFIPNASAVLFKKTLLNEQVKDIEMFNTMGKLKLVGDWYFWLNLLLKSSLISYNAQGLNYFRQHSTNVRLSTIKNSFTEIKYILRILKQHRLPITFTVETYLYRYFHRNKDSRFTFSERLELLLNAWRFGFLWLYIKNAVKYR